jgi:hypothetical protein
VPNASSELSEAQFGLFVIRYWSNGFVATWMPEMLPIAIKKALKFFRNGKHAAPGINNRLKS